MRTIPYRLLVLISLGAAAIPAIFHFVSPTAAQLGAPLLAPLASPHGVAAPRRAAEGRLEAPLPVGADLLDISTLVHGLEQRGFFAIDLVRLRGTSLLCEATSPRHQRLRLVVDLATGEVTGLQLLPLAATVTRTAD